MTTAQVAQFLAVSQRTIRVWAESGELPGIKAGRQWRFRREVVHNWLKSREQKTQQKSSANFQSFTEKLGINGIDG